MKILSSLEITQVETVMALNKIHRPCKDDPAGYGARIEKERQTEKRDRTTTHQNGQDWGWVKRFERIKIEKDEEKVVARSDHPWCLNAHLD